MEEGLCLCRVTIDKWDMGGRGKVGAFGICVALEFWDHVWDGILGPGGLCGRAVGANMWLKEVAEYMLAEYSIT